MSPFNVFMIGVGGQGIGLLSEVLIRAADAAGLAVVGCDTHGLAQRGGTVVSHLRIGASAHSPLIAEGAANLFLALERREALRAMRSMLRDSGTMAWYDASWQPLDVRLGRAPEVSRQAIEAEAARRGVALHRVHVRDLEDPFALPAGHGRPHGRADAGGEHRSVQGDLRGMRCRLARPC